MIIGVIVVMAIIGFIQEGKTEVALESLKKMIMPECTALEMATKIIGIKSIILNKDLNKI